MNELPKVISPDELRKMAEQYLKDMESISIIFIGNDEIGYQNPTLLFVRRYNAQKQAVIELMFSEMNVPNPNKPKPQQSYVA